MKVVQINNLCGRGSTGKIVVGISQIASQNNIDNIVYYFSKQTDLKNSIKITNKFYIKLQAFKSRVFGNYGFNSNWATKKLIKKIDGYNPDIVHIHNIHAHNVNFEILFSYLKEKRKKVIYTFHDCWAFTGYCPHFTMEKCNQWKIECHHCSLRKRYSWFFDKSKKNFMRKKQALAGLDLTIITPSRWLSNLVKESFLASFPCYVINNGINLDIFKPTTSNFKMQNNLKEKHIVLGVADVWSVNKGLDVFVELSKMLPSNYQIVLVGVSEKIKKELPESILSILRTQNQLELADIYSSADVFVNPTREEVLGLTNIEALACGTPVAMFNVGGSPECIDSTCGSIVKDYDIKQLQREIIRICETKPYSSRNCIKRAKLFDANDRFNDYLNIYKMFFDI